MRRSTVALACQPTVPMRADGVSHSARARRVGNAAIGLARTDADGDTPYRRNSGCVTLATPPSEAGGSFSKDNRVSSTSTEESMTSAPQLRRLDRIEVGGLFGIYDHSINMELAGRVTLLHGPNGVGKTTVLKMVDALLTGELGFFGRVPFGRLLLGFHDGAELELTKNGDRNGPAGERGEIHLVANGDTKSASVALTLRAEDIAATPDFLQRRGDVWIDSRAGELLTNTEVMRRYIHQLAAHVSPTGIDSDGRDVPWLREFLSAANSHFIEAQRLVRSRYLPRRPGRSLEPTTSRVVECSAELKKRIDDTMAEYGRRAQALDQSFPQRLLQHGAAKDNLSVEEIRAQMLNLDHKTKELKEIGILEETPIHQFQLVDEIDTSQAGVMTLYLEDTAEKLSVLEDLASRARLLLESLNGKFQHKQVRVDRDQGLTLDGDGRRTLPLDSLSSGEQHELILHYDLLFRVQPNTVVLLDEPELSLHIEWQSKFLSDLMAIVELSGFDALVATHSPHIVGDRDDLMVELAG